MAKSPPSIAGLYFEFVEPDPAYFDTLGRFVDEFARAEATAYRVLVHYSKLTQGIAAVHLSGVRIREIINRLSRLYRAGELPATNWEALEPIFKQLGDINKMRDKLLHYGASAQQDGTRLITTESRALTPDVAERIPMSVATLNEMRDDLRKIVIMLRLRHAGLPLPRALHPSFDEVERAPWRYTLPADAPAKGRIPASSDPPPHSQSPGPQPTPSRRLSSAQKRALREKGGAS